MDQSAQQKQESFVVSSKQPSIRFTNILPILTLVIGLAIGFLVNQFVPATILPQKTQLKPPIQKTITEAELPISLALLKNPIVYEWRGSVIGKVVAKDEHTLTLEDEKGNKITITDLLPHGNGTFKTMYLKKTDSRPIELTIGDISLGTTLRGEFFVFKNSPNTPVGSLFKIVE